MQFLDYLRASLSLKEKRGHFDLKSVVTGGTKSQSGFRVIGEYLTQFDPILRVSLN